MNKIVRFYNQNRIIIWLSIISIAIVIITIKKLNAEYKPYNDVNNSSSSNNTTAIIANKSNTLNTESNNTEKNDTKIDSQEITSKKQAIKTFLDLCKANEVDNAYNMISDDCKLVLYPTKEDFLSKYYNIYFDTEKVFEITNWDSNIYKVEIYDDPIMTGNTGKTNLVIDYMCVNVSNDTYKINLSGFLRKELMNINKTDTYLNVNVMDRQIFKDYEIYTLNIKNLTKADVYIDNIISSNMYIEDGKKNCFYVNVSDYTEEDFKILANSEKMVKLKFNRTYNSENTGSNKLIFGNMIIQNKKYAIKTTTETNQIEVKERFTTYPENAVMEISLK